MHNKSVITHLSLILMMGALIILVPITSINFPNVKAQEYGAYDDDSYSTYPTEINKYECQTGPFEGFFVSSVEFCKFNKFDIEKILVEIIKQEHQAHLVHQEHQEQQEQLVLLV